MGRPIRRGDLHYLSVERRGVPGIHRGPAGIGL